MVKLSDVIGLIVIIESWLKPVHEIMFITGIPQTCIYSLSSGARGIHFGKSLHPYPCFVCASSEGSGESAHMHSLLAYAISTVGSMNWSKNIY